jgi:hypothetical protein
MTMKNRTMVGLLLVCCGWGAAASAAQLAPTTCDRDCLRGQMTQFLYALVKHDVSGLPDAYRYENGQVMAGPDCKFAPGCQNISTQSLAIFQRLGDVQTRVIAVDERMGIVWLRMAWGVRERGGDQLTVWETFKVYDSQIHAVEAFMRILPVEKRNGGWE